jgi:hypothetical protein
VREGRTIAREGERSLAKGERSRRSLLDDEHSPTCGRRLALRALAWVFARASESFTSRKYGICGRPLAFGGDRLAFGDDRSAMRRTGRW